MSKVLEIIKAEMTKQGATMRRLAKSSGLSNQAISVVFSESGNPTLTTLEKLCQPLGLELRVVKVEQSTSDQHSTQQGGSTST